MQQRRYKLNSLFSANSSFTDQVQSTSNRIGAVTSASSIGTDSLAQFLTLIFQRLISSVEALILSTKTEVMSTKKTKQYLPSSKTKEEESLQIYLIAPRLSAKASRHHPTTCKRLLQLNTRKKMTTLACLLDFSLNSKRRATNHPQ